MSQDLYSSPSPSQSGSTKDFTFQKDNEEALLTLQVTSAGYFVLLAFSFRLTAPRLAGVLVADPQDLLRVSCLPVVVGHWALAVPGRFKYSSYL